MTKKGQMTNHLNLPIILFIALNSNFLKNGYGKTRGTTNCVHFNRGILTVGLI
jgi:hypothetical protein